MTPEHIRKEMLETETLSNLDTLNPGQGATLILLTRLTSLTSTPALSGILMQIRRATPTRSCGYLVELATNLREDFTITEKGLLESTY